eukprot:2309858-Alexandrium_andersonii.AAC.1
MHIPVKALPAQLGGDEAATALLVRPLVRGHNPNPDMMEAHRTVVCVVRLLHRPDCRTCLCDLPQKHATLLNSTARPWYLEEVGVYSVGALVRGGAKAIASSLPSPTE